MNNLAYYSEGDNLYQDMIQSISNAKESIDVESYILSNDVIGNIILKKLYLQSKQNIKVRVLIDSVGSNRFKNFHYFRKLVHLGFKIKWFNPWSYKKPFEFNRRNHRKLMLIDGHICYLGGFNIHNESSKKQTGVSRWKDSHIRFEGALVPQLKNQFNLMWQGKFKLLSVIGSHTDQTQIIPNQTRKCRIQLRCELLQIINQTKGTIRLATPYFIPDSKTLKALINAANNGVRVDLMVPKYSDHALLKYAAFWYYQRLLCAGIYIYEYSTRMMHSKYILSDQSMAIIGSANMDYRSFFTNYEIMLFSKNSKLIELLGNDFESSLTHCDLIEKKNVRTKSYSHFLPSLVAFILRRWL